MSAARALTDDDLRLLEAAEAMLRQRSEHRWCPHKPTERQAAFLACEEFEALFGGAAGGGKSDALLMEGLAHVDVPGTSSIVFRRTYKDLSLPGAIMDRAADWLRPTAAHWNDQTKTWTFPSGSTLVFGYLDHLNDRFRYQSAEFQKVLFDELTQFPWEQAWTYLASRTRRLEGLPVPLKMRGATNPGGHGHSWVKARWGLDDQGVQDPSKARDPDTGELRVFVPSSLDDNPHLDRAAYRRALSRLDEATRAQLERGLWVQDNAGLVLPLDAANLLDVPPQHADMRRVLCIDMGTSEAQETLAVAIVGWSPTVPDEVYVLHAEKHAGLLVAELAHRVRELEGIYGAMDAMLLDEGALGSGFGRELRQRHGLPVQPAEKKNRLGYARLFRDAARAAQGEPRPGVTRLYVVTEDAQPLVDEAADLFWHDDGKRMVGACHAYDGAMYAFRATRPWAATAPRDDEPEPGTPEAANAWADEHMKRVSRKVARQTSKQWWHR